MEGGSLHEGEELTLELTVPPGTHFPYQGRVATKGHVIRVTPVGEEGAEGAPSSRYGIGAKLEGWELSF